MANISRRDLIRRALLGGAVAALPPVLLSCAGGAHEYAEAGGDLLSDPEGGVDPDSLARLAAWTAALRSERLAGAAAPIGRAAVRVGELATGTPYEAFTLESYLRAGGSPSRTEPLTLSLTRFDCVSLVEACLAVARVARRGEGDTWAAFAGEMERMRYRGGVRGTYASRLHYFSEWMSDGAARGLLRELGRELGGSEDRRPLRFMTEHRESYRALANDTVFEQIAAMERSLDDSPRFVIPTVRIPAVLGDLESGDVIAFATSIRGLDVSHAAFAYRDPSGTMRVLHAPLSGGVVEVTAATLPQYVAAIRSATGILLARPLAG